MYGRYISSLQAHDDFNSTLRSITATASTLLACSHVVVYVHNSRTGQLVSRLTDGIADFSLAEDCGVAGATFSSGKIVQVDEPSKSAAWSPEMDLRTGFKTRSVLAAPLMVPGSAQPLGALEALNKHVGHFHTEDHTLLQVFSALAGLVLQGWHMAEVRRAMNTRYDLQGALTARLSTLSDLPAIARELHAIRGPTILNCAAFSLIIIEGVTSPRNLPLACILSPALSPSLI